MKKKIINPSSDSSDLETKLKQIDPEIQNFVSALKAENLKFQKKIAKLEAEKITFQNRITVLEEENSEYVNHINSYIKSIDSMPPEELENAMQKLLSKKR